MRFHDAVGLEYRGIGVVTTTTENDLTTPTKAEEALVPLAWVS